MGTSDVKYPGERIKPHEVIAHKHILHGQPSRLNSHGKEHVATRLPIQREPCIKVGSIVKKREKNEQRET